MDTCLMVSGMFRSGTTLLSTMLNAHPNICCASDPYLPIFKLFRDKIAVSNKQSFSSLEAGGPLDDYYFDSVKTEFMEAVQSCSLDLPLADLSLDDIRKQTVYYSKEYSTKIIPLIDGLGGETFTDLFRSGFEIVKKAYGEQGDCISAFKTAWTDEFSPHMLQAMPEAKVIHIIRDPRATCASKNVLDDKYPWLFLIRQWRKSAAFILDNIRDGRPWSNRIMAVRYEDLISNTEQCCRDICLFLGLEYDPALLDICQFRDGLGKPWMHNSSHYADKEVKEINKGSIDKWRNVLSNRERIFIELLCLPEMKAWGYSDIEANDIHLLADIVDSPPEIPSENLARWIRPYAQRTAGLSDMALEYLRLSVLASKEKVSEDLARKLYLRPAIVESLAEVLTA